MADEEQVELFKKYLIDTNAFQAMVQTLSSLHMTDPKPDDAVQFIRQRLSGTVDADEFQCMKQCLGKLNEDVGKLKDDITKIANMVVKLLPDDPAHVEVAKNTSWTSSLDNNIGNFSHVSMLDESSLIFDETLVNADVDLNATIQTEDLNGSSIETANTSQSKDELNDSMQGFTMEIVEVDVVQSKGLLDQTITTASQEDKAIEDMQIDEIATESVVVTSTPEVTTIEKLTDTSVANIDIEIAELPIIIKDEECEEISLSQDFRGFDVQDVQESQMHLPTAKIHSSDAEVLQEKFEDDPKVSQPDVQQSNTSKSTEIESAQKLVSKSIAMVIDVDEEKRSFVEDIVEKVVEGITKVNEDVQVADMVDNRKNLDGLKVDMTEGNEMDEADRSTVECIVVEKDDPETLLFLSYC